MKRDNIKIFLVAIAVAAMILIGLYKLNVSINAEKSYLVLSITIAIQFFSLLFAIAFISEILQEIFYWQKVRMRQSGLSDYLLDSLKSTANVLYNIFVFISIAFILIYYNYFWAALPLMLIFSAMLLEVWLLNKLRIAKFVLNLLNRISNLPNLLFNFISVERGSTKLVIFFVGLVYISESAIFLLNIDKYTDCVKSNGMEYASECYQNKTDWRLPMTEKDE
jgi:hypothetical protein